MHDVLIYADYLEMYNKTITQDTVPENQEYVYDAVLALTSILTYKSTKYGNKILDKEISLLENMMEIKFDRFLISGRDDDKLDLAGYLILWLAKLAKDDSKRFHKIIKDSIKD